MEVSALRDLLTTAFNAEELEFLCTDHFPEVRKDFTLGQTLPWRAQHLIDYCSRRGSINQLIQLIIEKNPTLSDRLASHLSREPSGRSKPSVPRGLVPQVFAQSIRLNSTANGVIEKTRSGCRLIALRGRVGDGKTEAARQAAALAQGGYLELPPGADGWRRGLLRLIEVLGGQSSAQSDDGTLITEARELIAAAGLPVLIIDNADPAPPFVIRDLLRHDTATACVVVGPGVGDVDAEVHLQPPSSEEFCEIAATRLPPLDEPAAALVREIGVLTDYSALCARCLAWQCSPGTLLDDLKAFRDAMASSGSGVEKQIDAAIEKCWKSLGGLDRRRLLFVSALGEPSVPLEWLPRALREGPPAGWRMLDVAGVMSRNNSDSPKLVRVHRLIALWTKSKAEPDSLNDLIGTLKGWTGDTDLIDELKMDGLRRRAFVQGFTYIVSHGGLGGLPHLVIDELQRAYVDCCGSTADLDSLEQTLAVITQTEVKALGAPVLAQLLDVIGSGAITKHPGLRRIRVEADHALRNWVTKHPLPERYDGTAQAVDVDVHRHVAKELMRSGDMAEAERMLRTIDIYCAGAANTTTHEESVQWRVRQTKARIQLASEKMRNISASERATLLLEMLSHHCEGLPDYLYLDLIRRVISIKEIPTELLSSDYRKTLIRQGLLRCMHQANWHVRVSFLQTVVREIEVAGARDLYTEVASAVEQIIREIEEGRVSTRSVPSNLPFVLYKAAATGASAASLELLFAALRLFARCVGRGDSYGLVHAAANLRELGRADLSVRLSCVVRDALPRDQKNRFWAEFEYVKSLRWRNQIKEAVTAGQALGQAYPDYLTAVRDELAKAQAAAGDFSSAASTLAANAIEYDAKRQTFFAERCRRWAADLPNEPLREDGLRDDEWRSRARRMAIDVSKLSQLDEEATRLADHLESLVVRSRIADGVRGTE